VWWGESGNSKRVTRQEDPGQNPVNRGAFFQCHSFQQFPNSSLEVLSTQVRSAVQYCASRLHVSSLYVCANWKNTLRNDDWQVCVCCVLYRLPRSVDVISYFRALQLRHWSLPHVLIKHAPVYPINPSVFLNCKYCVIFGGKGFSVIQNFQTSCEFHTISYSAGPVVLSRG